MKFKKGFSLIELLVSVSIIGLLGSIAIISYGSFHKKTASSWTKSEIAEVVKVMNMAKNSDGYYHQYIYAIGYRPKGKVYASVGTDASSTVNCCSRYPDPGSSPCKKNFKSGFLYYNCDSSSLGVSTDNIEICNDTNYGDSCDLESGLSALTTANFTACIPMAGWCDCNNFSIGAITHFGKQLTINQKGELCGYE